MANNTSRTYDLQEIANKEHDSDLNLRKAMPYGWNGSAAVALPVDASGNLKISVGGFTAGSIPFAGSTGALTQDNANLFWDDTNNRLGIGTNTPSYALEIKGTATSDAIRSWVGYDIYPVPDPTTLTATVQNAVGNVDAGTHYYSVTYYTATGETHGTDGTITRQVTCDATHGQVQLTLPISTDPRVVGRKIYRGPANGQVYTLYYLDTIADNTTATYLDNTADAGLNSALGCRSRLNTTSYGITVNGVPGMELDRQGTTFGMNGHPSLTTGGRYTTVGAGAGYSMTTASSCTFVGMQAGYLNSTGTNTAIGYAAGYYTSTGYNNTSLGVDALFYNATGYYNTALGCYSMFGVNANNQTYCTAVGAYSMYACTTADYSTALGYGALYYATSGDYNTVIGALAAGNTQFTDGTANTLVGYRSNFGGNNSYSVMLGAYTGYNSTGTNNIFLGYYAGYRQTTNANLLIVDNQQRASAAVEATNAIIYGTMATAATDQILGINAKVGINTTAPTSNLSFGNASAVISMATADGADTGVLDVAGGGSSGVGRGAYFSLYGNEHASRAGELLLAAGGSAATGFARIYTGSSERLRVTSTGLIGINTTAPTNRLDVRGTATTDAIRSAIGFDLYPVPNPTAPTVALAGAGAGNVDNGVHYYKVSYLTALGETKVNAGNVTVTVVDATTNGQVRVTIPVSTDPRVTGRRIHRSVAGGNFYDTYTLADVNDNTTTEYIDNIADASLPVAAGRTYFRANTTCLNITQSGTAAMFLDTDRTCFGLEAGANISIGAGCFFGYRAGGTGIMTGGSNNAFGSSSLGKDTSGASNNGFGDSAGGNITSGGSNTAVGHYSLLNNQTGSENVCIGQRAGYGVSGNSFSYNVIAGSYAGAVVTTGSNNVVIGQYAGYVLSSGGSNILIGNRAGFYQTTNSNILIIDNQGRTNAATEITNCMIYGVFNTTVSSQTIRFNALTTIGATGANALTIGTGTAGVDYNLTFDGETNDGVLTWMEDEDYFKFSDDIFINDAENIVLGTTTGTKIGTLGGSSGQKLGFWNATPIVQPVLATGASKTVDDVITVLQSLGLVRQS